MNLVKDKLRVVHFPQVGSLKKAFTVEVKDEMEASKIVNVLAQQHLWLEKNGVIPDYSNAIFVEMWQDDTGEGKPGWGDYWNEEELMEFDEFESTYITDKPVFEEVN